VSRALSGDEVHVWSVLLREERAEHHQLLSPAEREQAARFSHARARLHFVAGRALLREILADYLDRDPAAVDFKFGKHGKPHLADEADTGLRFNLSHSGELAVLAVARGRNVGVDVELISAQRATDDIAQRFFSPNEWAALRALPAELRVPAFFRCWTCKEAFIKLIGDGMTFPLEDFDVSFAPGEPPALVSVHGSAVEAERWTLHELNAPPDYAATLAIEGRVRQVMQKTW
jgi:4'-phosphopantetheinyl transferase